MFAEPLRSALHPDTGRVILMRSGAPLRVSRAGQVSGGVCGLVDEFGHACVRVAKTRYRVSRLVARTFLTQRRESGCGGRVVRRRLSL